MSGSGIVDANRAWRAIFWVGLAALGVSLAIGAVVSWASIQRVPFGAQGYINSIREMRATGQFDDALRELRADQRINYQDVRSSGMIARMLAATDREAAIEALAFAASHSFDPKYQLDHAAALVSVGRLDEADAALARALALAPERTDVRIGVGRVYEQSGRTELAHAAYREALERDPGSSAARRALVEAGGEPL